MLLNDGRAHGIDGGCDGRLMQHGEESALRAFLDWGRLCVAAFSGWMTNHIENLNLALPDRFVLKRSLMGAVNPDGRASVHSLNSLAQLLNFDFRHDLGSGERQGPRFDRVCCQLRLASLNLFQAELVAIAFEHIGNQVR